MGFGRFWNEKGYEKIDDEKVDLEHSEYSEKGESDVQEVQGESVQPKKYNFKDYLVYHAANVWHSIASVSFLFTLWSVRDKFTERKVVWAQLKLQLEDDGKREGAIRVIHDLWSDYTTSTQWAVAFSTRLIVLSVFFCSVWLVRREFSNKDRRAMCRAFEALFLLISVHYSVLTFVLWSSDLRLLEKDVATLISRGEW